MKSLLPQAAAILFGLLSGCSGERPGVPAPGDHPAAAAASPSAGVELRLRDVTAESALAAVYQNGREAGENSILESLGGGVALLDFDRDGVTDLFFPGGGSLGPDKVISGRPSSLWRGRGGFRFDEVGAPARAADSRHYTHGCAAADFDNDGFADLLVTGYGGLQLFHNLGDGTFREIASDAGMDDPLWSSSAAWGDFDGDGNLDLYAAHYVDWSWDNHPRCSAKSGVGDVCGPRDFAGLDDIVYFSNGDGTFRDATAHAGLVPGGKGLGVVAADLNNDGRLDVYVANDTTDNFLYLNEGAGRFRESGLISGTAVDDRGIANGSMGIAVLDFNSDLEPDLWVTNFEKETFALYRNERQDQFVHVSEATGITVLGGLYVGFGTAAADLDLDGDEDIAVANGHVMYHTEPSPLRQEPLILRNAGESHFARAVFPADSYFSQGHAGRGVAVGDLDGNGLPDLVFSNVNEPAAIIANETETPHTLLVTRLVGIRSNRDGIGARLILKTSAGEYLRTVCGGGSYLSQSDYAQTWGIPHGERAEQLTVHWPSGIVQEVDATRITDHVTLVEPAAWGGG